MKGEVGGGGHRTETGRQMKGTETDTGSQMKGFEGRQMKGTYGRETRRQRPRAAQNGDHEGRQMKGDKAAAALGPFKRFRRSATQSLRSKNPYSFQLSGE